MSTLDSQPGLTRRNALKLGLTALAGNMLLPARAHAASPTLNVFPDYGWLRGLGVIPSWAAKIEDAWWFYDGAKMREEVALAKQVHVNCIRLWIEFSAWFRDPDKVQADFMDAIAAIDENGMKVMPCLFNRWHDNLYDYGGSYRLVDAKTWGPQMDYVKALVTPLIKDERIMIWDLCNEPNGRDGKGAEFVWLSEVAATVRACGAQQPITMGTMTGTNITGYAPLVDVMCGHPYAQNRKGLEALIDDYKKMQRDIGKPFLVNETIPGALDDAVRAEVAKYYTEMLAEAGFGWMGWVIREGKAISTRRDRHDSNGINGGGYHPFFTKEGKLRGGLEFLTEKPKRMAPW